MKKLFASLVFAGCIHISTAQNVGIGTAAPVARLHVLDSSVVFSGTGLVSLPANNPPISGAGRRMMWYANKAAFRAGYVTSSNWDNDAVGGYSFGVGFDTRASGLTSVAFGNTTTASANYSTAMGVNTLASGEYSTAMGYYSIASGGYSTAMGFSNAKGLVSTSMGEGSVAKGYASTVIGLYNDSILTADQSSISTTTPLFIIGNGNHANNRSNALVALKNGNIGIGTSTPTSILHIRQGSAGGNIPFGPLSVESSSNAYIGLLTPDTQESGVIFGKNEYNVSGGIVYNNLNTYNGFQFRTNGNATRMVIDYAGRVGIGTETPNAQLQLGSTTSNRKVVLFEGANNDNQFYGFGVNGFTLRYQTPASTDDHVFYSAINSSSSRELMRIKGNGNVGIGVSNPTYGLEVSQRMRLRNGISSAGIWFDNTSNSEAAFFGMEDDSHIGIFGLGGAGWKFGMNTQTGALKINGSEGQPGQVIQSSGNSGAAVWANPTNMLYNNMYSLRQTSKVTINTNASANLPGLSTTITITSMSKVLLSFYAYTNTIGCSFCGSSRIGAFVDFDHDSNLAYNWSPEVAFVTVPNGVTTELGNGFFIGTLYPGTYTISALAQNIGPTAEVFTAILSFVIISQ
jgi:hypothetical protein